MSCTGKINIPKNVNFFPEVKGEANYNYHFVTFIGL